VAASGAAVTFLRYNERLPSTKEAAAMKESLDVDAEIEEAWAAEIERRIADVESGAVQAIPIDEALAQVRSSLK
jgi:putative addiction module component (TIGR02574 family)